MSEIVHFKILLLCKMVWQMTILECDIISFDANVDILNVKKIGLNDF
jgi:hypothetical protein